MQEEHACCYQFESFRVDPVKRVLWRGTERSALTARAFDTLLILIQNGGRTVEKAEIIDKVWGGAIVEENNLTQCISLLRKTLGEVRGDHRFIVTVPGRGYRFVADVKMMSVETVQTAKREDDAGILAAAGAQIEPSVPGRESLVQHGKPAGLQAASSFIQDFKSTIRDRIGLAEISLLGLAAILAAIFLIAGDTSIRGRSAATRVPRAPASAMRRSMLAVLPFENLTGDPGQDYLSDGFTEEVITWLGRLDPDHLGVIARTSVMQYKGTSKTVRQIASELGVSYVVEGSIRRSGNRVRASVQLIQAKDQTHIWAQSYEGPLPNILVLQERLARDVQGRIGSRLVRPATGSFAVSRPIDPKVYEAYLEGLYFLNQRDLTGFEKAAGEFRKATQRDPGYAPAYAGLANCYSLLGLYGGNWKALGPAARAAAIKGVALDGSLAETHTALAAAKVLYFWDWSGAAREFNRALHANPNYALAHHWYAALYLAPQGRYQQAIAEMELARKLDPVSPIVNTDLGWAYAISGNLDKAFDHYQEALHLDPRFVPAHFRLAQYYLMRRMYTQAVHETELDKAYAGDPQMSPGAEQVYRMEGFSGVLRSEIEVARRNAREPSAAWQLAGSYSLLGRNDAALQALFTLYRLRDPALIYLKVDPALASLRTDPRFQGLERRCGLTP